MSYESPNAVTCSQWVRSSAVCVCYLNMILVDAGCGDDIICGPDWSPGGIMGMGMAYGTTGRA